MMDALDNMARSRRIGAGFLFLLIAVALLFTQPIENQLLLAGIAALNLLISAFFFATIGVETVGGSTGFDVPTWVISVLFATAVYTLVSIGIGGELNVIELVTFVVGFGIGLAFFSALRERFRR